MPDFKRVSSNDAERYFPRRGQQRDLTEYQAFVRDLMSGDLAEVTIGENETERSIKHRLTVAAKRLGKSIQYSKWADEGTIVFRVK
jgi:hypothetical protein